MNSLPPLPDPDALIEAILAQLRGRIDASVGIVGIRTGGVWVAERLRAALGVVLPLGSIDVSFYRDDYGQVGLHPGVKPSEIGFQVEGRDILLVDDVLYTGRTVRAAINEIFDYGRPRKIWLAALVDRGGRELPFAADVVGAVLSVPDRHRVDLVRAEGGKLSLLYRQPGDRPDTAAG